MKLIQIILFCIFLSLLSILINAQNNKPVNDNEIILGALYLDEDDALRSSNELTGTKVDCSKIQKIDESSAVNSLITDFVKDISNEFSLTVPSVAKGIGLKNAYAIDKSNCLKEEEKKLILIGDSIPELYLTMLNVSTIKSMEVLKQKYILIAILAHEIAHLKQAEIAKKLGKPSVLNARELELHADFLAGWYIQRHKQTNQSIETDCKPPLCKGSYKNLSSEEKEFAILAATEKFYKIGGKTHGRYEDRLYWLSMGLRFASNNKSFSEAYSVGEKLLVNERELFKIQ